MNSMQMNAGLNSGNLVSTMSQRYTALQTEVDMVRLGATMLRIGILGH